MKKFNEIKTREELLERVVDGFLSCGNKYYLIKKFLNKEKTNDNMLKVNVNLSCYGGTKTIVRYI